jgi:hypothetical protein
MCVLTIPAGAIDPPADELPVDKLPLADRVSDAAIGREDCAAAKPIRADTMTDFEKYMLIVVLLFLSICS